MTVTARRQATFVAPAEVSHEVRVLCPECGVPAEIEWSDMVGSTDGPVEHAKIRCANRHGFLMPTERLVRVWEAVTPAD